MKLCYFKSDHLGCVQVNTEKAMAPHSSTLAWKIPWTEEPGGLQLAPMGLLRVRHDRKTSLSLFTFMHWRRKWQPTPVFLPGKSHGQRNLVGYSPWGRKESDTTEQLHFHFQEINKCIYKNKIKLTHPSTLPGSPVNQASVLREIQVSPLLVNT